MCENSPDQTHRTGTVGDLISALADHAKQDEALTLEEVENKIAGIYRFFAEEAPGVQAQEQGELGVLWRIADDFYRAEGAE